MRFTINEKDIESLTGKFIIQIDSEKPNLKITDSGIDLEFYLVKRIKFVMFGGKGIIESDLFGNTLDYTKERFISIFNDYDFNDNKSKGTRFHRLLTSAELDVVFAFMKKRNY